MYPKDHPSAVPAGGRARGFNANGIRRLRAALRGPLTPVAERVDHDLRASHPEYPLERTCKHQYEPFQLAFAERAAELLAARDDLELECTRRGLTIRGETEEAIDEAIAVLARAYGAALGVSPPTIRYHKGEMLEEPWMGLRVRCRTEHLERVKADLAIRSAPIESSEIDSRAAVLHVRAPLAVLIGYGAALAKLTAGSGKHVSWLSHYAPVDEHPPGGDAA